MKTIRKRTGRMMVAAIGLALSAQVAAQDRVAQTVHNLSVSGPGTVRAQSETQVCIFCHAPHNTSHVKPLWNRAMSTANYTIYQSSTLDALPGQPTGASKLCLSCHDGTIALGSVLSRQDQIRMVGSDHIPAGLTNLGTDLSDDHPISFHYTSGLAASDSQLVNPLTLPAEIRLDNTGQLQCTACHDPHSNVNGDFLVRSDEFGALCRACHNMHGWGDGAHAMSTASVLGSAQMSWPYSTVAENACRSCHRSHTAGGRERLLQLEAEEDNCLVCHNGQVAQTNIEAEINKMSAHDPRSYLNVHDPTETAAGNQAHVECADCHNPHAVAHETPSGEFNYVPIGATLRKVPGISTGGAYVAEAQYEYEVCYRCHGDSPVDVRNRIPRQSQGGNLRLKFNSFNPSFHPVVASSPNPDVPSLVGGLAPGSMIRCTDCHNNDSGPGSGGGAGPQGPHGSVYDYLLERNYSTRDNTPESAYEYAMCYKCHRRASILADESFAEHNDHLQHDVSCSACHDPHGVSLTQATGSDHTHLINFDTSIVFPLTGTSQLRFRDLGRLQGSCTLTCHGQDHNGTTYGVGN